MKNIAPMHAEIENNIDGIIIVDSNSIIQSANPSACALFDYEVGCLNGINLADRLFTENEWLALQQNGAPAKSVTKRSIMDKNGEVLCLKKEGTVFQSRLEVSEIIYGENKIYIAVLHSLSTERKAEEQLKICSNRLDAVVNERLKFLKSFIKTLEQAKTEIHSSIEKQHKANHLKSEFVAIASHEFRMPLTSIQLSASLIEHYYDRLSREKIFTHLQKIKTSVNYLTTILNDFLSVDKIENGEFKADLRDFDLKALIEGVITEMKLQAKPGQNMSYTHIGEKVIVKLDHNLVIHCLLNLISNAIKYSPENSQIDIVSELANKQCVIRVTDHGVGIPEEDRPRLFEPFFRAGNAREIAGTGLGLTIVKRYMDLIGGHLTFEPNETGSTFSLFFPDFLSVKN